MFFLLLYSIGWDKTLESLKKVSFTYLLGALPVFWIAFYLKSLRWKLISNSYGISLSSYRAFRVFFIGLFLANITPGKIGDFARLFYIKENLPNKKVGLASLIMDRLFDLVCLLFFSLIAIIYYQVYFNLLKPPNSYESILFWGFVFVGFILGYYFLRNKLKSILMPWLSAFNSHNLKGDKVVLGITLTFFSMILIYGIFNYVAWGMGVSIDHLGLFLGVFVLGVLSLLPITILGIGVRETSLVVIFNLYGLASEDAIALSLIIFVLQIISLIPGAIFFYLSPVEISQLKKMK